MVTVVEWLQKIGLFCMLHYIVLYIVDFSLFLV